MMMLRSSLMMGERSDGFDRYRDWRLNVDNMSYEVFYCLLGSSCSYWYFWSFKSLILWCKQELLELGDSIGYVNTGLKEDEIVHCLRKTKVINNLFSLLPTEMERKCSICQVGSSIILISAYQDSALTILSTLIVKHFNFSSVIRILLWIGIYLLWQFYLRYFVVNPMQEDYEDDDEVGKLECGHFYHIHCVKQWLMQKNTCPICKTTASTQEWDWQTQ